MQSQIQNNQTTQLRTTMKRTLEEYGQNRASCFHDRMIERIIKEIDISLSGISKSQKDTSKSLTYVHGDIHGDLLTFVKNLYAMDLIDNKGNWVGNNKHLIQLGDFLDKGNRSYECYLYLITLQKQAKESNSNSKVTILLGTHEKLVLNRERFANIKTNFANFCRRFEKGKRFKLRGFDKVIAFSKLRKMIQQDILKENIVASQYLGDILFIHGSIGHKAQEELKRRIINTPISAEKISNELKKELLRCVKENDYNGSVLIGGSVGYLKTAKDGIVHNREFMKRENQEAEFLKGMLLVVGHMPTKSRTIEIGSGDKKNIVFCDTGLGKESKAASYLRISSNENNNLSFDIKIVNSDKNILLVVNKVDNLLTTTIKPIKKVDMNEEIRSHARIKER